MLYTGGSGLFILIFTTMFHNIISGIVGLSLTAASFVGMPLHNVGSTSRDGSEHMSSTTPLGDDHRGAGMMGSTTRNGERDGMRMGSTTPTGISSSTILCVGAAVATREQSIGAAEGTLGSALASAYST